MEHEEDTAYDLVKVGGGAAAFAAATKANGLGKTALKRTPDRRHVRQRGLHADQDPSDDGG